MRPRLFSVILKNCLFGKMLLLWIEGILRVGWFLTWKGSRSRAHIKLHINLNLSRIHFHPSCRRISVCCFVFFFFFPGYFHIPRLIESVFFFFFFLPQWVIFLFVVGVNRLLADFPAMTCMRYGQQCQKWWLNNSVTIKIHVNLQILFVGRCLTDREKCEVTKNPKQPCCTRQVLQSYFERG